MPDLLSLCLLFPPLTNATSSTLGALSEVAGTKRSRAPLPVDSPHPRGAGRAVRGCRLPAPQHEAHPISPLPGEAAPPASLRLPAGSCSELAPLAVGPGPAPTFFLSVGRPQ